MRTSALQMKRRNLTCLPKPEAALWLTRGKGECYLLMMDINDIITPFPFYMLGICMPLITSRFINVLDNESRLYLSKQYLKALTITIFLSGLFLILNLKLSFEFWTDCKQIYFIRNTEPLTKTFLIR